MDTNIVKSILDWPVPRNVKEIQSFLGLANYYRKFIHHYANSTLPLYSLLKEDRAYTWSYVQNEALNHLKTALTSSTFLKIPDLDRPFIVTTDASHFALDAVLSQHETATNDTERLIAFVLRKSSPAKINYATHEKEILAVAHAIKKWSVYLEGNRFTVITVHAALKCFQTQPTLSRRQARSSEFLLLFDFEIQYRQATLNIVADALPCRVDYAATNANQISIYHVIQPCSTLLDQFREGYERDKEILQRPSSSVLNPVTNPTATINP